MMYLEEYLSLRDIAELLSCGTSTVHRHLIKHNLPRRPMDELNHCPRRMIPCPKRCGRLKSLGSKYKICKDCWAKEHGRTRTASGKLRPIGYVLKKRKFEACKNCGGGVATWNRTGYCIKCWELPEVRNDIGCKFCIKCEKSVSWSNKSGLCPDCSKKMRSVKTIFKREEAVKIFDEALSGLNIEGERKDEVITAFKNLLARRFFLGYTGNASSILRRR